MVPPPSSLSNSKSSKRNTRRRIPKVLFSFSALSFVCLAGCCCLALFSSADVLWSWRRVTTVLTLTPFKNHGHGKDELQSGLAVNNPSSSFLAPWNRNNIKESLTLTPVGRVDWQKHPKAWFFPPAPLQNNNDNEPSSSLFPPPKAVLLAGPHKTGSTMRQNCIADWTEKTAATISSAPDPFEHWSWPVPDDASLERVHLQSPSRAKGFAPLLAVLRGDGNKFRSKEEEDDQQYVYDKQAVLDVYRETMHQAWYEQDQNIIYGAEAIDYILHSAHNATEILQGTLDILPTSKTATSTTAQQEQMRAPLRLEEDLEVVVTIRLPRVTHLLSVWHLMLPGKRFPLSKALRLKHLSKDYMHMIDVLRLVRVFLEHGLRTTLFDFEGVTQSQKQQQHQQQEGEGESAYHCQLIACHIMGIPCAAGNSDSRPQDDQGINNGTLFATAATKRQQQQRALPQDEPLPPPPVVKTLQTNRRPDYGERDLSEDQLERINDLLNAYDCQFRDYLLQHDRFRVLFPHNLFATCGDDNPSATEKEKPFSWLWDKILEIAAETT